MTERLDRLRALAAAADSALSLASAFAAYETEVNGTSSLSDLNDLADQLTLQPDLLIPVLRRLAAFAPNSLSCRIRLGFAHYAKGEDEEASALVREVLDAAPENIDALNLLAALTPNPDERRVIYARMLTIDPHNRAAFDNLVVLRPPDDEDDHPTP